MRAGAIYYAMLSIGMCVMCPSAGLAQAPSASIAPEAHVHSIIGSDSLRAYVFRPAGDHDGSPRSAIVIFHGGGWAYGSAEWAFPRARHFAERGMVAIAAQYRLSDQGAVTPLEAMRDARAALRWVRAHADSLGVHPDRIAAYGWSAGAHLAASAAIFGDEENAVRSAPDALVLASPAVSLGEDGWLRRLLADRARLEDVNPIQHVRGGLPPVVILQGDVDTVTPLAGVREFCDLLVAAGNTCQLHVYTGFGHLFTPAGIDDSGDPQPDPRIQADALARADQFLTSLGFIQQR